MSRVFNFSAGPAALPDAVRYKVSEALAVPPDFAPSVVEIIHRGPEFKALAARLQQALRELLGLGGEHEILLLQGGAQLQFAMLPMNVARGRRAAYLETGLWSGKAIGAARAFCDVVVAGSSASSGFTELPVVDSLPDDCAYLYYCGNETVHGVQFPGIPNAGVPLAADLTSEILSRPYPYSKLAAVIASAQKNLGVAGLTVLVLRRDLMACVPDDLAPVLSYRAWADDDTMLNTPCTFAWYVALEMVEWVMRCGGLAAMERRNRAKAQALYQAIDAGDFYQSPIRPDYRSMLNVPFRIARPELEPEFVREATDAGLIGLKGHRSVGGLRASLYNALEMNAVEALIAFMRDFERRKG